MTMIITITGKREVVFFHLRSDRKMGLMEAGRWGRGCQEEEEEREVG